jgi:hypothetical protein
MSLAFIFCYGPMENPARCSWRGDATYIYELLGVTPEVYNKGRPCYLNAAFVAVRNITPEMKQKLKDEDFLFYDETQPKLNFGTLEYDVRSVICQSRVVCKMFEQSCGSGMDYTDRYEENMYKVLFTEYLIFTNGYIKLLDKIINNTEINDLLLIESLQDIVIDHLNIEDLLECLS